jgi:hypothetical protein
MVAMLLLNKFLCHFKIFSVPAALRFLNLPFGLCKNPKGDSLLAELERRDSPLVDKGPNPSRGDIA